MGPVISPYSVLSDIGQRLGQQMVADREAQRQRQQSLSQALGPAMAEAATLQALGGEKGARMARGLEPLARELYGVQLSPLQQALGGAAVSPPGQPMVAEEMVTEQVAPSGVDFIAEAVEDYRKTGNPISLRIIAAASPQQAAQEEALRRTGQSKRIEAHQEMLTGIKTQGAASTTTLGKISEILDQLPGTAGPITRSGLVELASPFMTPGIANAVRAMAESPEQAQLRTELGGLFEQIRSDYGRLFQSEIPIALDRIPTVAQTPDQIAAQIQAIARVHLYHQNLDQAVDRFVQRYGEHPTPQELSEIRRIITERVNAQLKAQREERK